MCASTRTLRGRAPENGLCYARGMKVITKDGYRTTVEAGRTALARAGDLLWGSMQNIWAQLKVVFKR